MNYSGTRPTIRNLIAVLEKFDQELLVEIRGTGLVDIDAGIHLEAYKSVDLFQEVYIMEKAKVLQVVLNSK